MVHAKVVRGFDAARQIGERDPTSADHKSGTPAPRSEADRQTVSSNPGGGDDTGSLARALGVADPDFAGGLFGHLLAASARGPDKFDTKQLLFTLAVIKAKNPKHELDIMLLAQMSAVHAALMKASGVLAQAETVLEVDTLTRTVNQLARAYAAQYDAFNRHHGGIEQQVAAEGGQAIVGNVAHAAAAAAATARQTPFEVIPALTDGRGSAMEILGDAKRVLDPVPARRKGAT